MVQMLYHFSRYNDPYIVNAYISTYQNIEYITFLSGTVTQSDVHVSFDFKSHSVNKYLSNNTNVI